MKRTVNALFSFALALALALSLGSLTLRASAQEAQEDETPYAGYLVMLRPSASGEVQLFGRRDPEVPEALTLLNGACGIYQAADLADIRELVYEGRVILAEPNYQVELFDVTATPNDPHFNDSSYQYNLKGADQHGIGIQAAWDAGLSGDGVTVAIIDSGLNTAHLDGPAKVAVGRYYYFREYGLSPNDDPDDFKYTLTDSSGKTIKNPDGTDKKYSYFSNSNITDDVGHGTAIAGIIAAKANNRRAIAGIAPNVTVMPIRCFTNTPGHRGGYASNVISGLGFAAANGADVINMSWGLSKPSEGLQSAINAAANAGCILIAAVGNDGNATYRYPAAYDNVIGVGATNKDGTVPTFSQQNDSVHVFAPGRNLYSLGWSNSSAIASGCTGTSFAAPQVAAVAALLRQADPQLTHSEFARLLTACSTPLGENQPRYTDAGFLDVQALVDQVGTAVLNVTASPGQYSLQACLHPGPDMALADNACLVLVAAYNEQGHLIASAGQSARRSDYGGYQYSVQLDCTGLAFVRAFFLKEDGSLAALRAPIERSVGQ